MSFVIGTAASTQDATFADSISTSHTNPAYCGAKVLTLSPTFAFVSISGTNIVVDTTNPADVGGPHSITLTVALADYSSVVILTKNFSVTITCAVQTLTFVTAPVSPTLLANLDPQPVDIPVAVSKYPDCLETLTFEFVPNTNAFLSIIDQTQNAATIRLSGATIADAG